MSCYFYFVLLLLDQSCGTCNVILLHFMCFYCNGSVCLVCCVFVNCLVKQFAICLGVVVMEMFKKIWVELLCWIDRVWSSK